MTQKILLEDGDAALVIRKDMTMQWAIHPQADRHRPSVLVMGCAWSLENEEWCEKLAKRVVAKLEEMKRD